MIRSLFTCLLSYIFFGTVPAANGAEPPSPAVPRNAAASPGSHPPGAARAPAPAPGALITDVRVQSSSGTTQAAVPLTFGQVFAPGALRRGESLIGRLAGGRTVALQLDVKATHPDGSVRHAVISTVLPALPAKGSVTIGLLKSSAAAAGSTGTPADLLASGFKADLRITIDGKPYHASADQALKAGRPVAWLAGPLVNEWLVTAPLKTAEGVEHPHLHARYALRAVGDPLRVRVDVSVENDWAFEPGPKNLVYDAELSINGKSVYTKTALLHYHHARWRKVFWSSGAPQADVLHNTAYLIASRAVPNYDQHIVIAEPTLAAWKAGWTGAKTEPMGVGIATPYMPTTGGRLDIGLLPGWAASYVLSMDPRAREVTLGTSDLAGSWSIHYRDRATNRPVSVADHPYMTLLGHEGDTFNPATKKSEAFPACAGDCKNASDADSAHQPGFSYLAYLVTGDFYHLEELQFWAMYDIFQSNPAYREAARGLLYNADQLRGQAWTLRTLAEAAYIAPDNDPLKKEAALLLNNNLDWYNHQYSNNPTANRLGVIAEGVGYDDGTATGPWQDDFFTQAVGHAAELGFEKARPLLLWKSKFPIGRMTDPDFCWIMGAAYTIKLRDSKTAPFYTFGRAYRATVPSNVASLACASPEMAAALKLKQGEMSGYSGSNAGYPSNMQPALAYSADIGGAAGAKAWKIFESRTVKPDYSSGPQFAIVPR